MNAILAALEADPNISPVLRNLLIPRYSTCGRRMLFETAEQAREYEAGWCQWPDLPESGSAEFLKGWHDRDQKDELDTEARIEAREAQRDAGDR